MESQHGQQDALIRMEWRHHGATAICAGADCAVIVEDLWGAGAVIAALEADGAAAFRAIAGRPDSALAMSSSGQELVSAGFGGDVCIAAELDASSTVPVLREGRFVRDDGRP